MTRLVNPGTDSALEKSVKNSLARLFSVTGPAMQMVKRTVHAVIRFQTLCATMMTKDTHIISVRFQTLCATMVTKDIYTHYFSIASHM